MHDQRTHIDLFSGIGGFAIAANAAGYDTRVFCEQDDYCTKVLNRHWPGVPVIRDIREFDGTQWRGADLLTGGFPCQPFSQAGKQGGTSDDRHLWPEMLRIIKEARPRLILGENVAGIIKMALDDVLSQLEGEGYSTGTVVLPACAVNAPHRRDRVWIVANLRGEAGTKNPDTDSKRPHREEVHQQGKAELPDQQERDSGSVCEDVAHTGEQGLQGTEQSRTPCENTGASRSTAQCGGFAGSNWTVEPDVGRVANGIPNRTHRLKALGNA